MIPPRPPADLAGQKSLEYFRAQAPRPNLHPLEKTLLVVVSAQLVFLPWALGGMRAWSQFVSLGFSATAFVAALIPRNYYESAGKLTPLRAYPSRRLLRFPLFWLGLAFLSYVLTQALNPAWIYETDGKGWWLRRIEDVAWLPSGMITPFSQSSPWRSLLIDASVWLTVSALWTGFTRRRTFQLLFTVLAANAFLLSGVGLFQRLAGNGKILGFIDAPASYFVATFIYKNHAAAYLNLLLALTAGLTYWSFVRGQRRLERSNPAGIFAFFATAISVAVLFSYSRGGTILLVVFLVSALAVFALHQLRMPAEQRSYFASGMILLLLVSFVGLGFYSMRLDEVGTRMQALFHEDRSLSITGRERMHQATWEMAQDNLAYGWGAGGFRFYFPVYQSRYPEIYANGALFWEHAHSDYLETLAEVGLVGSGLIVLMLGYAGWQLSRRNFWRNPLVLLGSLGLLMTLAHAWFDFPFQNPAILTTWCVLLVSFIRWAELEQGPS